MFDFLIKFFPALAVFDFVIAGVRLKEGSPISFFIFIVLGGILLYQYHTKRLQEAVDDVYATFDQVLAETSKAAELATLPKPPE